MRSNRRQFGSVAVECALTLPIFIAVLMMVLHVGLLCIHRQSKIYDSFMRVREQWIAQNVAHTMTKPVGDNPVCAGGTSC